MSIKNFENYLQQQHLIPSAIGPFPVQTRLFGPAGHQINLGYASHIRGDYFYILDDDPTTLFLVSNNREQPKNEVVLSMSDKELRTSLKGAVASDITNRLRPIIIFDNFDCYEIPDAVDILYDYGLDLRDVQSLHTRLNRVSSMRYLKWAFNAYQFGVLGPYLERLCWEIISFALDPFDAFYNREYIRAVLVTTKEFLEIEENYLKNF